MDKTAREKITSHFYNLGMPAAHNTSMYKTAASAKDIARMLGRGSAYTLPTVGTLGGAGAGATVGFDLGKLVAGGPLREVMQKVTGSGDVAALLQAPEAMILAGIGMGTGTSLGALGLGLLGNKGGNLLKDKLLRRLA